jgi:hypothetical protein
MIKSGIYVIFLVLISCDRIETDVFSICDSTQHISETSRNKIITGRSQVVDMSLLCREYITWSGHVSPYRMECAG